MVALDSIIAMCLVPLGIWILLSGLDDMVVDAACAYRWFQRKFLRLRAFRTPTEKDLRDAIQKRIAIFVPLWHEHQVIAKMLEHNISAQRYENYDFFVGVYPNDELTLQAVREVEAELPNVHLAVCANPGPTSKADNLNWIFQRMLLFEEEHCCRFDIVITHDAEDLIHPEALRWINYYGETYDMVQIPVLALPTPFWKLTHGVYIDDFSEYQFKDMIARQVLRGFLPSNGVGAGFSRYALERLAATSSNQIFEPSCLTEDYENGLRLHKLKCLQCFVPITYSGRSFVATREYFPQRFKAAVKQRTRWVTGIALQSWERNGWRGPLRQVYWFWRDRKGLIGNPVSLLANWILMYGIGTWWWASLSGADWGLAEAANSPLSQTLLWSTLFLQIWRMGIRAYCVSRVYGWGFAAGVPLRTLWANWINCFATVSAIKRFALAKLRKQPLVWLKTEHAYPTRSALMQHKRKIGEILVRNGHLEEEVLEAALEMKPAGMKIGEYLVEKGRLSEGALYQALSLQQNLPLKRVDPKTVKRRVARALPANIINKWHVLPCKVTSGNLFLVGPELPSDEMQEDLRAFVKLEIRFQLVTRSNYEELRKRLLRA